MTPLTLIEPFTATEVKIVIASKASAAIMSAAKELRYYLRKLSGADRSIVGAKIIIVTDSQEVQGPQILLGKTNLADVDISELGPEGYIVRRVHDAILLLGASENGTCFAVYHFLEEVCGVRWFWPGPFGEDIPVLPRLIIDKLDIVSQPSFKMRNLGGVSGEFCGTDWARHHRLGGSLVIHGVHSWGKMIPPNAYGPTYPEYFALVEGQRQWKNFNGKHGCQLCTTNPNVISLCVAYIRNFFDSHPAQYAFNISPNDGGGFCECPDCRKLNNSQTCTIGDMQLVCVSGQIFTFANTIARQIKESHPDRYLIILAYNHFLDPPAIENFRLCDNVIVQFCLHCDLNNSKPWLDKTRALLDSWATISNKKAVYEYLVWRGNAELPRVMTSLIPNALKLYYQNGVEFFFSQFYDDFGPSGLNYYITAKLLWDVHADVKKIIEDYYARCFGSAAKPMRDYYQLLEARWAYAVTACGADYYPGSPVFYLEMYPPEVLRELDVFLRQAEKSAESYKTKARVQRFRSLYEYICLTMEALGSLHELELNGICHIDKAWPSKILAEHAETNSKYTAEWDAGNSGVSTNAVANTADKKLAVNLLDAAIDKWKTRNDYIEFIKDAEIIDYWHIKYDVDHDYINDPTEKLIEIKRRFAQN